MKWERLVDNALQQAVQAQTGGAASDAQILQSLAVLFSAMLTSSIAKSADAQSVQTSKLVTLLEANL